MKGKNKILTGLIFVFISMVFTSSLYADSLDDISMTVVEKEHRDLGSNSKRLSLPVKQIILEHMISSEELSLEEVELLKAEQKALRESLKLARETSDQDQIQQLNGQLKQNKQQLREKIRTYLGENNGLRDDIRQRQQEHRESRREEIRDSIQERREQRQTPQK